MILRPRRSVLYMPGSNARALEKAKTLDADALILDLEDAVAPEAKETAREQVGTAVGQGGYGHRELIIRINGMATSWGEEDLAAAVVASPNGILVPKVDSPEDILDISERISAAGGSSDIAIWAMMETPLAVLRAKAIASAARSAGGERLSVFVMGTNDLAKESRVALAPDRAGMTGWLMNCLAAARAYGLDIIDGVYNDIANADGFADECRQGQILGMDGKTIIHPSQIGPCNEIFSPTDDEVAWSHKIIEAFRQPENQDQGVIRIDGKMVELLHAEIAERVVAIADAIRARQDG